MARIRTIKPEFPQSESMGRVSRNARLLFVLLWTLCDDSGRTRGNSRMLASLLFPYDDDAPGLIDGWIAELQKEACIERYAADGSTYIEITNWLNHQKIDKPSPSKIPAFVESSRILANSRECSSVDQGVDQGIVNAAAHRCAVTTISHAETETQPKISAVVAPKFNPVAFLTRSGATKQAAADYLAIRRAKKAPPTETALMELVGDAEKAGVTVQQALEVCCKKNWVGYDGAWQGARPTTNQQSQENLTATQRLMRSML